MAECGIASHDFLFVTCAVSRRVVVTSWFITSAGHLKRPGTCAAMLATARVLTVHPISSFCLHFFNLNFIRILFCETDD